MPFWASRTCWAATSNDTLLGNNVANLIIGNGGGDTIEGRAGNDILIGDKATTTFDAATGMLMRIVTMDASVGGADIIRGDEGDDLILGGFGGDMLHGDGESAGDGVMDGNDVLIGDAGEIVLVDGAVTEARTLPSVTGRHGRAAGRRW